MVTNRACGLKTHRAKDLLYWATGKLKKFNVETPRLDAEVLLAYAMQKDRVQLYLDLEKVTEGKIRSYYKILIGQRSARIPVSYITGHKEFMSLEFAVNENVLIPRPETEILVETVCKHGKAKSQILEIGTGSGAIAVSLAKYNPDWCILATDLSMEALLVAQENARYHGVTDRVSFLQGDLLSVFSSSNKFDWVVSNPPYIPANDLVSLPIEIRKYEPTLALDGGADGLDVIKRIIIEAPTVLKSGGQLAIEMGHEQSGDVQKIADETKIYSNYSIVKDYSGIPRIFHCTQHE